jgi:hypothetical protein
MVLFTWYQIVWWIRMPSIRWQYHSTTSTLETESNRRYMKCKESAHVACLTKPISQNSSEISSTCIPLISKDNSLQRRLEWSDMTFQGYLHYFHSTDGASSKMVLYSMTLLIFLCAGRSEFFYPWFTKLHLRCTYRCSYSDLGCPVLQVSSL